MKIKKIFTLLLAAALLAGLLPQVALAQAGDTFFIGSIGYKVLSEPSGSSHGTAAVYDYLNTLGSDITIPASIQYGGKTYNVTAIDKFAFRERRSLESVVIPYGVTSIGYSAFDHCTSLDSVGLPDSITSIGDEAFNTCSLDGITLPNSLTSIGSGAFFLCDDLENVTIPDRVTSIGEAAFNECRGLKSVSLPRGITSISTAMFQNCYNLANVTIPDSITTIGDYAFASCSNLASITIPGSVNTIGIYAFNGNALVSIGIPASVTAIADNAFRYCAHLLDIRFSGAVPPAFGVDIFAAAKSDLLVFTPKSSESAYSSALAGKLPNGAVINPFVNSDGTQAAPFLIGTAEQLTAAAGLVNKDNAYFGDRYYQLTADIDLGSTWTVSSGTAVLTGGTAWTPMGMSANGLYDTAFRGTFDGQGHIIERMYVNGSIFQGLFGMIDTGGVVKNVGLANSYIEGDTRVGAIAGANSGTIKNCFSKNNLITGANYTGGVVGHSSGFVSSCYNTGEVTGTASATGGIMGYNRGILSGSYSVGTVSGIDRVGGISGVIDGDGQISNSYYCTQTIGTNNPPSSAVGIDHNSTYPDTVFGKTMSEIGALAPILGVAFMQDSTNLNNGYPVLAWEIGYLPLNGAGTEEDPYSIATAEQLRYMSLLVVADNENFGGSHYRLTADIDLGAAWNAEGTLTSGTPWTPIGSNTGIFYGSFDGQGHTIRGLYINSPSESYQGLFRYIGNGSTVKNVGVTDSYIKAKDNVGGIVGLSFNGTISNCYHTGSVSGASYVGGILGIGTLGTISGVYHAGSVSATGNYAGGLVGWNGGTFSEGYYNTDMIGSVNAPSSAVCYNGGTVTSVSGKTSTGFAGGEVAYLLQSGQSNPSVQVWGQALSDGSPDAAPVLTSHPAKQVLKAASFINGATELSAFYANTQTVTITMPSPPGGMIWMAGGIGYEAGETVAVTHYTLFTAAAPTYTITAIGNQTFTALEAGYMAGLQEEKRILITKSGIGHLANLAVALSGTNNNSFSITQPQVTLLNGTTNSTTFTVKAKDGLTAGTYTAVVTISATNLSPVSFNVTQVVNPAVLQSIAITVPANKRVYTVGETLDISGLVVTGTYSDGLTRIETITAGCITGFDSGVPVASQTLTVTVGGKTATYTVSINAAPPGNTVPNRKASVPAAAAASVTVNTAYTLDLSTVFEDADGDPLTYKVSINGTAEVPAGQTYTYTPVTASTTTLEFKASDGTADSTDTYTVTLTANAALPQTYTLTIMAGTGGSITTGRNSNYAAGTVINIAASAFANYSFDRWTSASGGAFGNATSADTTFTMPANAATIAASFKYNNSSSGGGGGSSAPSAPLKPTDTADNVIPVTTLPVTVNAGTDRAAIDISSHQGDIITGGGAAVITVPSIPGVTAYTLSVLVAYLSTPDGKGTLTFNTDTGSLTLPANMLDGITGAEGTKAEIFISEGDKSGLPDDVKASIGDRPLIQLAVTLDGKQTEWNNPNAQVTVAIPYTPTAEEFTNPESIIIWYIDGSGRAVSVPDGHYDQVTGTVTFKTTHFSYYAIGYNKVSFKDVTANAWYNKAVGFVAARGITTGTGNGNYSPDAKLTRGEFLVMLMKAYGIAPDANPKDNFKDAGSTYYTGYLAAAKRLGISEGVGNNMFAPDNKATRQEMFTLLYNALKAIGRLPNGDSGKSLSDFSDAGQIESWAKDAMALLVQTGTIGGNAGKLFPAATVSRAEMAQVLYNLLAK